MRLNPFRALRPDPKVAARVASPPYDVVSRGEAAELAKDNPLSFLHIVRSDIDLPEAVEPHDASVYLKARENLDRLVRRGALLRDWASTGPMRRTAVPTAWPRSRCGPIRR